MPVTQTARADHLISLGKHATLDRSDTHVCVWHRYGRVAVGPTDLPLVEALRALNDEPVSVADLENQVLDSACATAGAGEPVAVLARLHWLLGQLGPALAHTLAADGEQLLRVVPLTGDHRFEPGRVPDGAPVALSRLALLRRRGDQAVLEASSSPFRVELLDSSALALAAALAVPQTVSDLAERAGQSERLVAAFVATLAGAGMTDAGDADYDQWNFHELLFHSRSRMGRHDEPFGATFPFLGDRPPLPPVKEPASGRVVELVRPELSELIAKDPPLVLVQEGRRSVRSYGDQPMTVEQLGEFLYRVGRVRAVFGPDDEHRMPYEAVDRPYPTGGASADLEIYVTAARVAGLARAAYHYDAARHRLVEVCTDEQLVDGLLFGAAQSTGGAPTPDALITFTSRFGRLTWKYDGMAYAATLKHVGVAYQTCYLVATAMRLAPCGLGSGDAHLAARAFGLDWQTESSVGEFILGSMPAWADGTDPHAGRPKWRPGLDPQWSTEAARLLSERTSFCPERTNHDRGQ